MKRKILYILLLFIVILTACKKDFLDVNSDPTITPNAPLNLMLTGAEVDLAENFCINSNSGGIGDILTVYIHQTTTRENIDQYGVAGTTYSIDNVWQNVYRKPLMTLEYIINKGTNDSDFIYRGIAKILKAYTYSQFVDIWGDVPFSEASNFQKYPQPRFDKGADIYKAVMLILDEGIKDLYDPTPGINVRKPASDDLIYTGNVENWIRCAYSIKLKLLNQQRLVNDVTADVNAILAKDSLIGSGQDFQFWFGTSSNPENRHPIYIQEYAGVQMGYTISPWFYNIMKGNNADIFQYIEDPRIPYYLCNQLGKDNQTPQNPVEYLDGDFLSINFGSVGPNRDFDQRNSQTTFGIYPAGGKYDDGWGGKVTGSETTGNNGAGGKAPFRFLTAADVNFIRAELASVGITTENPKELLKAGIEASFEHINYAVSNCGTKQIIRTKDTTFSTVPTLADSTIAKYVDSAVMKYYDANPAKRLEIIMTQKWISDFGGSTVDMYSDYRRTGFPIMFDPNTDGDPLTVCNRNYPLSMPWSNDELTLNPKSPVDQKPDLSASAAKVFWDK